MNLHVFLIPKVIPLSKLFLDLGYDNVTFNVTNLSSCGNIFVENEKTNKTGKVNFLCALAKFGSPDWLLIDPPGISEIGSDLKVTA